MRPVSVLILAGFMSLAWTPAIAQERAYFVTYDHYLEERGNLEIAVSATTGLPKRDGGVYTAPWLELEYGFTGWWTAELYLEGVTTRRNGSGFTGWRWENRFRPLRGEHRVNPVLYIEYESINEASRIQKEIVGSGRLSSEPIADLRHEHARELEAKIIMSSAVRGWNISENFIFEKNLSADEGFEFGYAVGVSRSLGGLATGTPCRFCRENFVAGVEAYGGLGGTQAAAWAETRHFIAPVLAWHVGDRSTLKVSTGIGLTGLFVLVSALAYGAQARDRDATWIPPADEAARTNPIVGRPDAAAGGRKVFQKRCATCHGGDGRGTPKAPSLSERDVQAQTDGTLYWKISHGNTRTGMPAFSFLPEPQRWQLVLHVRSLTAVQPSTTAPRSELIWRRHE